MRPKDDGGEAGTRAAILAAALEILTVDGHQALSVRKVATRAGCSTIGVYTWFGGKDGLVDAIWVEGFRSFAAALRRARPGNGPLAGLMAQARAYRRWALAHPMHYQVMFLQAVPGHTPSDEATVISMSAFEELQKAVARAADDGELYTDDLESVAMTLWGTVHGLVALELANPGGHGRDEAAKVYDVALETLGRGLLPTVPPRSSVRRRSTATP